MAPSPPVARPPSSLMCLSICRCSAVAPASDHLLNETRVSGPHIFPSNHRSPTTPDCGSFESLPFGPVGRHQLQSKLHERPKGGIMKHGANLFLQEFNRKTILNQKCHSWQETAGHIYDGDNVSANIKLCSFSSCLLICRNPRLY